MMYENFIKSKIVKAEKTGFEINIMEYKDFIKLVKELREAQKAYFKATHGTIAKVEALKLSKKLEKQVDDAIRQFEGENAPDQAQQSLFG